MIRDRIVEGAVPRAEGLDGAYRELFEGNFHGLVRLARLLGADDPEDLVQDAFVRLHRKRAMLRDPNASLAYLRTSVCNACRSRVRHLRMARRRQPQLALTDHVRSAEHQAVDREDIRRLLAAVENLPRRQREVLVLRYWLDLTERETAETMGIALGTVKATASRAIAALAVRLEEGR